MAGTTSVCTARELELNLCIKPKRRLKRDYPGELDCAQRTEPNVVDGRYVRSVNERQNLLHQCDGRLQPRRSGY